MEDCIDDKCPFKDKLHVHFDDNRLDIVENDKYTFIFDKKDKSYTRISKSIEEFIKY